jgi:hypothetical protein
MDRDSRSYSSFEHTEEGELKCSSELSSASGDIVAPADASNPSSPSTRRFTPTNTPPGEEPIEGWKDIARYFGVVDRTAQLWEQTRGLPVRRKRGPRGRVYAYPSDLAAWYAAINAGEANDQLQEQPGTPYRTADAEGSGDSGENRHSPPASEPHLEDVSREQQTSSLPNATPNAQRTRGRPGFRPGSLTALTISLICLFLLGAWAANSFAPAPLSRLAVDGLFISAYSPEDRVLWRYRLPFPYFQRHPARSLFPAVQPLIADLDGDGRMEALAWDAVPNESGVSDTLYCFSAKGQLRWTFQPKRVVRSSQSEFSPTYNGRVLVPVRYGGGKTGVLAAAYHRPYHPTQVVLLSAEGEILREYWHTGYFLAAAVADLDKDGHDEIYLGGISNAYNAAVLVVLDPDTMEGASLDPVDPTYQLLGFPPPSEIARIVFPRTALSLSQEPYNLVQRIGVSDNELVVTFIETTVDGGAHGSVWFHFDANLQLTDVSRGDNHVQLWESLRSTGILQQPWTEEDQQNLLCLREVSGPRIAKDTSQQQAD